MAINRKLGKTTDIRLAMLKTQVTDLLLHGQIETTVARAKEVQPMAEKLIALAIREKDNFEEVDSKVVKAKLDSNGNKVTELVKSKNGNEYLKVIVPLIFPQNSFFGMFNSLNMLDFEYRWVTIFFV